MPPDHESGVCVNCALEAYRASVRPTVTYLVVATMIVAIFTNTPVPEWFTGAALMIVGAWFAERGALKQPRDPCIGHRPPSDPSPGTSREIPPTALVDRRHQ